MLIENSGGWSNFLACLKAYLEYGIQLRKGRILIFMRTKIKYITFKIQNMKVTPEHAERIAKMTFASVYPHYLSKVEKKGRTKDELYQVIKWLTGYDEKEVQKLIDVNATFETFFSKSRNKSKCPPNKRSYMRLSN